MPPSSVKDSFRRPAGPAPAGRPAVLFDLDGTLVDSSGDLTETLRRMFREDGLNGPERSEVVRWVGDGAAMLVERAYSSRSRALPQGVMARFQTHHDACLLDSTAPYPGIPELLRLLAADRELAVVTNKPGAFAERVVAGCGLAEWIPLVVGPERAPERKPSPLHVLAALELLGRRPEEAVVVGDGTTDIRAGREAGAATVAVLWGYRGRAELEGEGPSAVAATVAELAELLGASLPPPKKGSDPFSRGKGV